VAVKPTSLKTVGGLTLPSGIQNCMLAIPMSVQCQSKVLSLRRRNSRMQMNP